MFLRFTGTCSIPFKELSWGNTHGIEASQWFPLGFPEIDNDDDILYTLEWVYCYRYYYSHVPTLWVTG